MSRHRWFVIVVGAALTVGACGKGGGSDGSRRDVARALVKKLAMEAYPQWAVRPSNAAACPSIEDLAEYVGAKPDLKDPWGAPFVVQCGGELPPGARGVAVSSAGPDGRAGTADDVKSWD